MVKTCLNCKYFHTVMDSENSNQHWHGFCSKHGVLLKGDRYYNYWKLDNYNDILYDDFETGIAECYLFENKERPFKPDDWFEENKKFNDSVMKEFSGSD